MTAAARARRPRQRARPGRDRPGTGHQPRRGPPAIRPAIPGRRQQMALRLLTQTENGATSSRHARPEQTPDGATSSRHPGANRSRPSQLSLLIRRRSAGNLHTPVGALDRPSSAVSAAEHRPRWCRMRSLARRALTLRVGRRDSWMSSLDRGPEVSDAVRVPRSHRRGPARAARCRDSR